MSVARALPTRVQRREFVAASDQNWCGPRPRWNWRRGPSLPSPKFDFVLEGIDGVQCAMPMTMHGHSLVQFPSARCLDVTAKVGGDFFPGIQPALHVRSVTGGVWVGHIGSDLLASGGPITPEKRGLPYPYSGLRYPLQTSATDRSNDRWIETVLSSQRLAIPHAAPA